MSAAVKPGEANEELHSLSGAELEALRDRSRHDLFFLSHGILGYEQVNEATHGALCAFMTQESRARRMVLMPRGHLKSTICTIADSIRITLKDPENTRILIGNEVSGNAEAFLKEIKAHWERNEWLRQLFPELVPKRITGAGADWGAAHASIQRYETKFKESTYTAWGTTGAITSAHFSHAKLDDLIGLEADTSPAKMAHAIGWNDQIEPLMDNELAPIDWVGTRWSLIDVYNHVMEGYGSDLAVFRRKAIEFGQPIFYKFTLGFYERIMRINPRQWHAQYENDPIGGGLQEWDPQMVQYYQLDRNGRIVFVDRLKGGEKSWALSDLDVVITCDPNGGEPNAPDAAAIVVSGVSPDDEIFVLDSRTGRWDPSMYVEAVHDLAMRWRPRIIGFEKAGQQTNIHYFQKICQERQLYFRVEPLHHENKQKAARIRMSLDMPVRTMRIYLHPSMVSLKAAFAHFPQIREHEWDALDALAYGPKLWQKGVSEKQLTISRNATRKVLTLRGTTGYGV